MVDREHAGPGDHPARAQLLGSHNTVTRLVETIEGVGLRVFVVILITPPPPKTQDCHSTLQRSWCSVARLRGRP